MFLPQIHQERVQRMRTVRRKKRRARKRRRMMTTTVEMKGWRSC